MAEQNHQRRRGRRVRILCHNVAGHWLSSVDPPDILGRVKCVARHALAEKVDVLVLQELYTYSLAGQQVRNREFKAVEGLLRDNGFVCAAPTAAGGGGPRYGMSSGLCVFSRLPAVEGSDREMLFAQQHRRFAKSLAGLPFKGARVCDLAWEPTQPPPIPPWRRGRTAGASSDGDSGCGSGSSSRNRGDDCSGCEGGMSVAESDGGVEADDLHHASRCRSERRRGCRRRPLRTSSHR